MVNYGRSVEMLSKLSLPEVDVRFAYNVQEVCVLVGISRASLYAAWKNLAGPERIKVCGRVLVRPEAIVRWLAIHEDSSKAAHLEPIPSASARIRLTPKSHSE
jgi:predicted DNA-binding transcriptional regulator AlpA